MKPYAGRSPLPVCMATAASVIADFSPAERHFTLPQNRRSARLEKALAEMGSDAEFRDGVAPLESLGICVSHKTIQRVSEAVGAAVAETQHGALASANAPEKAPANPPDLLVIEGDGMRLRQLIETGAKREDGEPDNGWRECKVGVVIRCQRGKFNADGSYDEPRAILQTHLATLDDIKSFGPRLKAEAERRGMKHAREVIALSDAGHGLPGMWKEQFPGIEWIVDFSHTAARLFECAQQLERDFKKRAKRFHRWKGLLFDGKMDKLLKELRTAAQAIAPRPETLTALADESPERILWTHIQYLETYREHMDYQRCRRKGWPISSGHVEATCKRIGNRMKGANKRWTRAGAESIATLICDRASGDDRWNNRWPKQIRVA
jgi:hypothetical protein